MPPAVPSGLRRLVVPPRDALGLLRWVTLLLVPLSLVPFLIGVGRAGLTTERSATLALLAVASVAWAVAFVRDVRPWLYDALHLPLVVAMLLAVTGDSSTSPAMATVFTLSMMLQLGAGPWSRFFLRFGALAGGVLVAGLVADHAALYPVFGVGSANLFSYLLGRALERQERALARSRQLTSTATALAAAASPEAVGAAALAGAVALGAQSARAKVELVAPGQLPVHCESPLVPSSPASLALSWRDERGVEGKLWLWQSGDSDPDLEPALMTLLTAAVQATSRVTLQRSQHELEIAARIQTALVPRRFVVPGFDVAAVMLPAAEVGGDYFDLQVTPGGCCVGIGDVAGHGLSAGLVMLMAQSVVAALVRVGTRVSPSEVVVRLNDVLYENVRLRLEGTEHLTFSLLRVDQDGTVVHAGAHEDLLVHRAATGAVERISTAGTWLGAAASVAQVTHDARFNLFVGDTLLLHTDGIVEARDGGRAQFGLERLEAELKRSAPGGAARLVEALVSCAAAFSPRREDDWSLVALRYLGVPA